MTGGPRRGPLADQFGRLLGRRHEAPPTTADDVLALYAGEGVLALSPADRARLPAMSRCVNCGLCAMIAGRLGRARLPDLPGAYLRDLGRLAEVAGDLEGGALTPAVLAAAAAVCPVGVPLDEVAATVLRLAQADHA